MASHNKISRLIKERRTIRKYKNKEISDVLVNKILEGGIWGPSVLGKQTWKFIVIRKKSVINEIVKTLIRKAQKTEVGLRILLNAAAKNISGAPLVICAYNCGLIVELSNKFGKKYSGIAKMAEVASIAGALQNIIIVSESLGIGACWHDIPLLCENSINRLLGVKEELIAVMSLGYPNEKGSRSIRKKKNEMVKLI